MRQQEKHGLHNAKIYGIWRAMKARCQNPNNIAYQHYGARGITVCEEWQLFSNFYKDMGERPKNKSLDRIDNNKGYYKDNCRWTSKAVQMRNTRRNVFISYKGQRRTHKDWAIKLNIKSNTLRWRLKAWGIEKALSTYGPRSRKESRTPKFRKFLTYKGKTLSITQWARQLNLKTYSLSWRIDRWGLEKALETPKREKG